MMHDINGWMSGHSQPEAGPRVPVGCGFKLPGGGLADNGFRVHNLKRLREINHFCFKDFNPPNSIDVRLALELIHDSGNVWAPGVPLRPGRVPGQAESRRACRLGVSAGVV